MFALLWGLARAGLQLVVDLLVASGCEYPTLMLVRLRQAMHWQGESPPRWFVLFGPLALSVSYTNSPICSKLFKILC